MVEGHPFYISYGTSFGEVGRHETNHLIVRTLSTALIAKYAETVQKTEFPNRLSAQLAAWAYEVNSTLFIKATAFLSGIPLHLMKINIW
jgi:hypothetical protein